jgi:tetratricopeptide (TPR) repeat protein
MNSRERRLAASLIAAMAAACATPPRPPAIGEIPVARGTGEATAAERKELDKAHRDLQQGHTAAAEKRFRRLSEKHPRLVAARTGLAYVRLKQGMNAEAARLFALVIAERPTDLDARLGAGETAARLGDLRQALEHYARATEAHPGDATAKKRYGETKLTFIEQRLAAAREAAGAGSAEEAIAQYRQALEAVPEVSGLRIELAKLLADKGDLAGAVAVLAADPTSDPLVLAKLGEVRTQQKDHAGAVEAYARAVMHDSANSDLGNKLEGAQRAYEFARMPEEYQRIYTAAQITRADLAALIDVKVTALAKVGALEPKVAVDISGSWAKDHIIKALALDIISVYPNHTFQPGAMVRRGDLARAVARVLDLLNWPSAPTPAISDMGRNHLYYDAVSRAVSAGLMDLTPERAFEAWRPVSGEQAVAAIEALSRLVGP